MKVRMVAVTCIAASIAVASGAAAQEPLDYTLEARCAIDMPLNQAVAQAHAVVRNPIRSRSFAWEAPTC